MHGHGGRRKSFKLKRSRSKRMFRHGASRTHAKNIPRSLHVGPMRGGIRL